MHIISGGDIVKKLILPGVIFFFLLTFFVGCGDSEEMTDDDIIITIVELTYGNLIAPNTLMGNASAENSAFSLSVFNGETVWSGIVFQGVPERQALINELQRVPVARVTGWTPDDITLPIYGISMGTTCGRGLRAAWSNGFWITQRGA